VVVLTSLGSAVDQAWAGRLRDAGVPVLEGLGSGLRAVGHLLAAGPRHDVPMDAPVDEDRRTRWRARLAAGAVTGAEGFDLLADYGLEVARPRAAGSAAEVLRAAHRVGYPVVLKTAAADVHHKVDVAGVTVGLPDAGALVAAYEELAARLGPDVLVQPMVEPGVELALGVVRDPHLGPLVLVAAGGTWVELVAQRAVALPPLAPDRAARMLDRVPLVRQLLDGARGREPVGRAAVEAALVGLGQLAYELGDSIEALDVNPLICDAKAAVAVDVLVEPALVVR
jgi:acyl-CoA synthetase (NDP forming)